MVTDRLSRRDQKVVLHLLAEIAIHGVIVYDSRNEAAVANEVIVRIRRSQKIITRNRRFVRITLPPRIRGAVNQDVQLVNYSLRDDDDDEDEYYHVQQQGRQDTPAAIDCQEPQTKEHVIPQPTPQAKEPSKPGLQRGQLLEITNQPQAGARDPHQQNGHYYCHCVQEDTPPQGPYKVGPPEPYSEASQKQTHCVSEQTSTFPHSTVYGKPVLNYKTYQAEVLENQ